jgi:hypothetical protein
MTWLRPSKRKNPRAKGQNDRQQSNSQIMISFRN